MTKGKSRLSRLRQISEYYLSRYVDECDINISMFDAQVGEVPQKAIDWHESAKAALIELQSDGPSV